MARIKVQVRVGAGVGGYSLFVDGVPATMAADHRGEAVCAGRCGDGSRHALLYSFSGVPAATLGVTLRCEGHIVCRLRAMAIEGSGEPWRAGRAEFAI